jgi:hypothetical protein
MVGFSSRAADPPDDDYQNSIRPLLETYCWKCHGETKSKGGLKLSNYREVASIHRDPKTWQLVLDQLRDRNMPPDGKPQPTAEERDRLIQSVQTLLENLDERFIPKDPGRVVMHRLSRLEYNNTVRDLVGADISPADKFPGDGGGGGGFDNNADTLFVPPILMEKYLQAADDILVAAKPESIFVERPGTFTSAQTAARRNISEFARRAFRRPVDREEVDRYFRFYAEASKRGEPFENAVKQALRPVLVSPNFLFRVEQDQTKAAPYRISDFELASRLSYFLWSSMPDEELFRAAERGRLHESKMLEQQVKRMLVDPKSRALAENFTTQWLRVRELKAVAQPDPGRFPIYTEKLRDQMYAEPSEFFGELVARNESVLNFLDSDFAVVNEELARFYGIPGVQGDRFRRVPLKDRTRGGVLGMAGVLTLTSYPLRTSPVLRGKWVLEEVLGTPPPPPPAMVKSLPADDKPDDGKTLRQRLEEHRNKPECASCHKRMDPLGFGLENFDPIGRWRTDIAGEKVDASGMTPGGETFSGPVELKKILMGRKEQFVRNLSERMLAYALGRGLEIYDLPAVKRIYQETLADDGKITRLILEITQSFPFQYRRNSPVELARNHP